ncbi:MAG: NAD(P)-dependent oxidoreductase [Bacteroidota bacterium]|nr:NAD(P)-dependent oxidoreductase [Candidatus Kapabacteria bacterium]MDW8220611.1 NAD(P)-dependent oxidoreductase [Bacteroidota bacterium]
MRMLITGGMGFFGWNAATYLRHKGVTVYCASSRPDYYSRESQQVLCFLDVLSMHSIEEVLQHTRPDAIVHAAALSAPIVCEHDPVRATAINVEGTKNILHAASRWNIPVVLLSTDLVFDGKRKTLVEGFYTEKDIPNAQIVYGQTKIAAEELCTRRQYMNSQFERWIILRTALMFGNGTAWTQGFPQFAIRALQHGRTVRLFTDQFRTPIYIPDVAEAVLQLLERECFAEIYHCGGTERIDRVCFVERYCAIAGIDSAGIIACRMDDIPNYTTRVADVSLDSSKLCSVLGNRWVPTPLDEAFRMMVDAHQQS